MMGFAKDSKKELEKKRRAKLTPFFSLSPTELRLHACVNVLKPSQLIRDRNARIEDVFPCHVHQVFVPLTTVRLQGILDICSLEPRTHREFRLVAVRFKPVQALHAVPQEHAPAVKRPHTLLWRGVRIGMHW